MINILANLETLRKQKGYTQTAFAEKLGLTQGMVSMIENGERDPSLETLLNIASALGVTVDELIGRKDEAS